MSPVLLKLSIWCAFSLALMFGVVVWLEESKPSDFLAGVGVFGSLFISCLGVVVIYARWRWPEDYGRRRR